MPTLAIRLFGRLSLRHHAQDLPGLDARKAQELLAYILLHRDRPHARETLAGLLWSDVGPAQAKAYLRKTLWQLQSGLDDNHWPRFIHVDEDWVQYRPHPDLWLDIAAFEQAHARVRGIPGRNLDPAHLDALQRAVDLYQGDLLEGWYHDWCLFERAHLQQLHIAMLEKLIAHCEAHRAHEAGLDYGMRILRLDPAHERTHRRLMRLHYLSGDRTSALRQYDRCADILGRELGVRPERSTLALHDAIKHNRLQADTDDASPAQPYADLLDHLGHFRALLDELQRHVRDDAPAPAPAMHD